MAGTRILCSILIGGKKTKVPSSVTSWLPGMSPLTITAYCQLRVGLPFFADAHVLLAFCCFLHRGLQGTFNPKGAFDYKFICFS